MQFSQLSHQTPVWQNLGKPSRKKINESSERPSAVWESRGCAGPLPAPPRLGSGSCPVSAVILCHSIAFSWARESSQLVPSSEYGFWILRYHHHCKRVHWLTLFLALPFSFCPLHFILKIFLWILSLALWRISICEPKNCHAHGTGDRNGNSYPGYDNINSPLI